MVYTYRKHYHQQYAKRKGHYYQHKWSLTTLFGTIDPRLQVPSSNWKDDSNIHSSMTTLFKIDETLVLLEQKLM
jgi:hypothetical protein